MALHNFFAPHWPNPVSYTHLNHGPFTWGKDAGEAVHNAVVLEEVAKMNFMTEVINPKAERAPQCMQDKHFLRKHGPNAYYGQN